MEIGGFQRMSLIDYPGKITSIVFVTGCNMLCPFCHNADLVLRNRAALNIYSEQAVLDKLEESRGFVDAVEITGGEPTLCRDLAPFIGKCKKMGLLVKLDTNGTNPAAVKELLDAKLIDYVAMDIKSALDRKKYAQSSGVPNPKIVSSVNETRRIIMESGIDYEFRTTVVPGLVEIEDLVGIAESIRGAKAYYLQQFSRGRLMDPGLNKLPPYGIEKLYAVRDRIISDRLVQKCEVRAGYSAYVAQSASQPQSTSSACPVV